jgi:hypothetical protein
MTAQEYIQAIRSAKNPEEIVKLFKKLSEEAASTNAKKLFEVYKEVGDEIDAAVDNTVT